MKTKNIVSDPAGGDPVKSITKFRYASPATYVETVSEPHSRPPIAMPVDLQTLYQILYRDIDAAYVEKYQHVKERDVPAPGWHLIRPLGSGSFGAAFCWENWNADGNPTDRIVVKDGGYDIKVTGDWTALQLAAVDIDGIGRVPKEAINQALLTSLESHAIVGLRSYHHDQAMRRWRFYTEFAQHGDLVNFLNNYIRNPSNRDPSNRRWVLPLPEEFLWHVFGCLCTALGAMHQVIRGLSADDTKQEILHLDIHNGNIFVDEASEATLMPYPVTQVGDWGLSQITGPEDADNPVLLRRGGMRAPEQIHIVSADKGVARDPLWPVWIRSFWGVFEGGFQEQHFRPHKNFSEINIWQVGRQMLELMDLRRTFDYPIHVSNFTVDKYNDRGGRSLSRKDFGLTVNRHYSSQLIDLVRDCLELNPRLRPSVVQVVDAVYDANKGMCEYLLANNQGQVQDFGWVRSEWAPLVAPDTAPVDTYSSVAKPVPAGFAETQERDVIGRRQAAASALSRNAPPGFGAPAQPGGPHPTMIPLPLSTRDALKPNIESTPVGQRNRNRPAFGDHLRPQGISRRSTRARQEFRDNFADRMNLYSRDQIHELVNDVDQMHIDRQDSLQELLRHHRAPIGDCLL